jgi:hypothetical protein
MAKPKPNPARATRKPAAFSLAAIVPLVIVGIFLPGIFLVPYYVPLKNPSGSQSWEFGFNNTVGQGFIALMLLALFAWMLVTRKPVVAADPVSKSVLDDPEPFRLSPLLYTMGILQMLAGITVLVWFSILPMSHYGEITYFVQRLEAMLMGQKPYVDFAFDYGPFMLTLPAGVYHLTGGAISVEGAYAAALIIHFAIGMGLLAYVVSQVNLRGRVFLLAVFGFQWINPTMGLNYTPLRFTIALASLFAIRHIRRATREAPSRRMLLLGLAAFILPLVNFAISPEMGLALTISLVVYFLWSAFGAERRLALLALPVLAGFLFTALVFPRPYFDSILGFGKGGENFPIFPTIHIVTFLAAAIWVFPRLGLIAVRDRSEAAPFCAGLAILCGLFILPATGRCDPGHIFINSEALFFIALAAASWLPRAGWYSVWGVYILIFPLLLEVSNWNGYQGQIEGSISMRSQLSGMHYDADNFAHLSPGAPRPILHYSKLLPMEGLDTLPQAKIGLPLGDNEVMERFFKLTGRYVPEYHIAPYSDVFAPEDMDRKYQDMRRMDYIFLPSTYFYYLRSVDQAAEGRAQADADNKFLSGLLLFPIDLPLVHPLLKPDRDITRRIANDYRQVVKQYQSGVLLKRTAP